MSEGKREALAKAAVRAAWPGAIDPWPQAVPQGCWLRVADYIIAREAEREGPLVEALVNAISVVRVGAHPDSESRRVFEILTAALKAHRALDALLDERAEALKREEGKR